MNEQPNITISLIKVDVTVVIISCPADRSRPAAEADIPGLSGSTASPATALPVAFGPAQTAPVPIRRRDCPARNHGYRPEMKA